MSANAVIDPGRPGNMAAGAGVASDGAPFSAAPVSSAPEAVPAALELDVEHYRADIADLELSDAQADELLRTLWSIMAAMVDLGFRVDLADPCGQLLTGFNAAADDGADAVDSTSSTNTEMPSNGTDKDHHEAP